MADAPAIKTVPGWRWYRKGGFWYIRGSRDRNYAHYKDVVERTAEALRATGRDVEIEVDDRWRKIEERHADQVERSEARREALDDKAERLGTRADAITARAKEMADLIPFGQPILVGHHSEGWDRRFRNRIAAKFQAGYELDKHARQVANRARAVRDPDKKLKDRSYLTNRIDEREAELRGIGRDVEKLETDPTDWEGNPLAPDVVERAMDRHADRAARIADELDWFRFHLAELPEQPTIRKGDLVRARGRWEGPVLRVNTKTVTVPDRHISHPSKLWTTPVAIADITAVQTVPEMAFAPQCPKPFHGTMLPGPKPWPDGQVLFLCGQWQCKEELAVAPPMLAPPEPGEREAVAAKLGVSPAEVAAAVVVASPPMLAEALRETAALTFDLGDPAPPLEPLIDVCRRIVDRHQHEDYDGVTIDAQTAHRVVVMWDAINAENRQRFLNAVAKNLPAALQLAWQATS